MNKAEKLDEMTARTQGLPPVSISEIVLKSFRFSELRAWYEVAFGYKPMVLNEDFQTDVPGTEGINKIAFFKMRGEFPYTQVLAIFGMEGEPREPGAGPGLHHGQFKHGSLDELFTRYEALRDCGINPAYAMNHGPGTSFYYEDPDGNVMEFSSANYNTEKEYLGFMASEAFRKNIAGIEVDPVEYVGRFRSGTPQADLVKFD